MKRDLLIICGGLFAVGLVFWAFWGNPQNGPRLHTAQSLQAEPDLTLISERSPYMRTER